MKIKNNMEIRNATRTAGLKLWQVAEAYGMTESSFSRMLRKELSPENNQKVIDIIHHLQERLD
ncbi:MAG TPA: hypothetical protein PKW50_10380 [Syntrophomonas sp.]|nr:hypothetical protein [Syntrophomonas sp.]